LEPIQFESETEGIVSDTREKGAELERRIATFLRDHGYEVSTNVVREGRSGARHELDVVATKNDGLTTFVLVVECKAWSTPIDKDVVFKLSSEISDIGAAKGVIATLSGWTLQAGQVALQLNIELWGPDELADKMGRLSWAGINPEATSVVASGHPFVIDRATATSTIERLSRGKLGIGREEVGWFGPLRLPTWALQLGITRKEGLLKQVARTSQVWNGYDALGSTCVYKLKTEPTFVPVNVNIGRISPKLNSAQVEKYLNVRIANWRKTSVKDAKVAHVKALARLGIQVPLASIAVETAELIHYPLWVAFLRRRGQDRILAIDGITGDSRQALSEVLTKNAQQVRSAISAESVSDT
jgi:hypothetical protein